MKRTAKPPADPTALRCTAAAPLKASPVTSERQSEADLRRLHRELEVYQAELEKQNNELRATHAEVAAGLGRYIELYDFSPVGYFNLAADGTIRLVNLTGARLVGIERTLLLRRNFITLLAGTDRRAGADFLARVFATGEKQTGELALATEGRPSVIVHLEAALSPDGTECRAVMTDITGRKRAEATKETLLWLTTRLSEVSTPRAATEGFFEAADQLWDWDAGTLHVYSPADDRVWAEMYFDTMEGSRREVPSGHTWREPSPRMRRIMRDGSELILRGPTCTQTTDSVVFGDTNRLSASILCVPIRSQGQAVGIASIQSYTPNAFTKEDLKLFQSLADACGGALERLRAAEALRASEERLRILTDNARVGLVVVNPERQYIFANSAYAEILGLPSSNLAGRRVSEVLGAAYEERVRRRLDRAFAGERMSYELRRPTPQGEFHYAVALEPAKVGDTVANVVAVIVDITERKRAEVAVSESEHKFRSLFESMEEGVALHELVYGGDGKAVDYRIVDVNPAFQRQTGLTSGNPRGRLATEVYQTGAAPYLEIYEQIARSGAPHSFETWFPPLQKFFSVSAFSLKPGWFATVFTDITERKRAEAALRQLSSQLNRAQEYERRRIARELHDSTGQKLAALSMTVGLLQDATSTPESAAGKMFADCVAMIEQCAQEIRTLSYLLHPPFLDELGLAAAIREYVSGFMKRSGVQVAFVAPPDFERLPDAVEMALFRVVQESLGNIHRHAGTTNARIRLVADAAQVTLEVSDQGRGMSTTTLRAIATEHGSTAGVGITGMRERLRLVGGRLEIKSGRRGTMVRAIFPRPQPQEHDLELPF